MRRAWNDSDFKYYHQEANGSPLEKRMRTILSIIQGSHPERRLPATTVTIESLNLKPKQKSLYLFDYMDEWQFEVEILEEES
jgi:hypothetical protein